MKMLAISTRFALRVLNPLNQKVVICGKWDCAGRYGFKMDRKKYFFCYREKEFYKNEADKKLYFSAVNFLREIGVPTIYNGYYYIMEASVILVKEIEKRPNVTSLYEGVSEKYDNTAASVERGIKFAILKTWETENHDKRNSMLSGYINKKKEMPTNMQFIRAVADYLTANIN
jgi:hypothetical protein